MTYDTDAMLLFKLDGACVEHGQSIEIQFYWIKGHSHLKYSNTTIRGTDRSAIA